VLLHTASVAKLLAYYSSNFLALLLRLGVDRTPVGFGLATECTQAFRKSIAFLAVLNHLNDDKAGAI
jgi:hypothetical protein